MNVMIMIQVISAIQEMLPIQVSVSGSSKQDKSFIVIASDVSGEQQ
jgi:hypothetical protein